MEFIEVSPESLRKLEESCGNKKAFSTDKVVDLKDWEEPWVSLNLGVKPHNFLEKVIKQNLFESEPSTLGYTDLKLSISLMKFLDFNTQEFV